MKSWITFLLPNDEYKEKRMLYFLSEGAIILMLTLIGMIIMNNYLKLDAETYLLLSIAVFLFYVSVRYTMSGIEYTDVSTERSYRKELKHIFIRTGSFVSIYILVYLIFTGVPSHKNEWIDIIGLLVCVGLVWFITSYISLKRSYKKNKELL
ncbi:DUF3278 domain-containing protein [Aquibacillus koreensis]|uniref:DUF3278 domain-containing protein n=1 Tax=Aquibacillus koreensis TaxID=279446 RepID=A0A9X4AH16_9BACI|nr:DUF3278 domain-containing protein [Aquibacillus koreensis]MCT2534873.1 DUF3278 domain-containing protein [Aquibacillus koreensis]MDC3419516.1 DUF3278 domain-containing protein [Aquibacillus koreensis]